MKALFRHYIYPDPEAFDGLWSTARIVLDTNVLLNLYRISQPTRQNFLEVLSEYRDRVWLPNQVAWEFFENRPEQALHQQLTLKRAIEAALSTFEKGLHGLRKDTTADEELVESIKNSLHESIQKADHLAGKRSAYLARDTVLDSIIRLFDGKVAPEPSEEWLQEAYKAGTDRCLSGKPPGFKDYKKKKDAEPRRRLGDYLLWAETIKWAVEDSTTGVILVTDDRKEDWFHIVDGETLGPLPELRREMYDNGLNCWIYSSSSFLEHASNRLNRDSDDNAVQELREARDSREMAAQDNQALHRYFAQAFARPEARLSNWAWPLLRNPTSNRLDNLLWKACLTQENLASEKVLARDVRLLRDYLAHHASDIDFEDLVLHMSRNDDGEHSESIENRLKYLAERLAEWKVASQNSSLKSDLDDDD